MHCDDSAENFHETSNFQFAIFWLSQSSNYLINSRWRIKFFPCNCWKWNMIEEMRKFNLSFLVLIRDERRKPNTYARRDTQNLIAQRQIDRALHIAYHQVQSSKTTKISWLRSPNTIEMRASRLCCTRRKRAHHKHRSECWDVRTHTHQHSRI